MVKITNRLSFIGEKSQQLVILYKEKNEREKKSFFFRLYSDEIFK